MNISIRNSAAGVALALLAGTAPAHGHKQAAITVHDGWVRATAPGQADGGGFLTIVNDASQPDRLASVSSRASASAQVHSMTMDHGVMRMRAVVGGLAIPAHGRVELKPGSFHVMLLGLKHPLRVGENVTVTLRFEHAGTVSTRLAVEPAGATGPGVRHEMGDMPGMDMGHGGH